MKKILFIIVTNYSFSNSLNYAKLQVENIIHTENQKKIYHKLYDKNKDISLYTPLKYYNTQKKQTSGKCFKIDNIDTSDIKIIDIKNIVQRYNHRCLSIKDIINLTNEINNIYIKKYYITSRAYIKQQDLSKGNLKISAIEGKVDKILSQSINPKLVFIGYNNSILNLRDLESRIEQLNRLQSLKVTMKLIPSKKVGYSDILLLAKKIRSPFHGSIGVNNFGNKKNGKYNISLSAGYDNPFNLNDLIEISLNTTNKRTSEHKSQTYSISYSIPIGKSYVSLSYSKMTYSQLVDALIKSYKANGESKNISLSVEYKLFHTKNSRGKLNFSLTHSNNKNFLAGEFLKTSSTISTIFTIGYTYKYSSIKNWDISSTLQYHRGLKLFGATTRTKLKPTFNKFTLDLILNKKFIINKNSNIVINSAMHAQYANKNILSSQFIGIGGVYSVRGFESEAQLSGNKGFYIRNDLAYNFYINSLLLSPYISYDYGRVSKSKRNYGGHISSWTLGLRANYKDFNLDMFYSKPISDSNKITYQENGDPIIHKNRGKFEFKLSYNF